VDPFTTAALAAFAGKAAARFGGQQLASKVADLAHTQQTELALLRALDADLDRVLAEPFLTATRLIEDANQPWRTDQDRELLLQEARSSLTRALAIDTDNPLRRSCTAVLLAGVWAALGYPEDAELRVNEAHELAIEAARRIADKEPRPSGRVRTVLGMPRKHRPASVRSVHVITFHSLVSRYYALTHTTQLRGLEGPRRNCARSTAISPAFAKYACRLGKMTTHSRISRSDSCRATMSFNRQ